MDWLEAPLSFIDCFEKRVLCLDDEGRSIKIHGIKRKVSLCFILTMKIICFLRKGCWLYIVEEVSDGKGPFLYQYLVLLEFKDVFWKELSGLPLESEIDFNIELKLDANPISKTPYRMTTPKLCEL